jgi:glutaconate CoA-transferase, subunit A
MSRNKIVPVDQLSEFVLDGSLVGLGGAWLSTHPMTAVRQLVRDGRSGLHFAETMGSMDIDLLVGAGVASAVTFSMVSLEAFGLPPHFRRAVQAGEIRIIELTGLALNTAFEAASRNIPFLPMASLGLSEVPDRQPGWYARIEDPFGGRDLLAVKALTPDVALLHVRRASANGDCQYDGPMAIDPEIAASPAVAVAQEDSGRTCVRRPCCESHQSDTSWIRRSQLPRWGLDPRGCSTT